MTGSSGTTDTGNLRSRARKLQSAEENSDFPHPAPAEVRAGQRAPLLNLAALT
jgi:hypothetical protein